MHAASSSRFRASARWKGWRKNATTSEAFLTALDQAEKQGRHVSENSYARNYAPKNLGKMAGIPKTRLTEAMERLFAAGKIQMVDYGKPSRGWRKIVRKPCP